MKRTKSARALQADPRGKRRDIIEGARRTFQRHGFKGATVSLIAAEARVSKRTLYQYFSTKEELFKEIVSEMCDRILFPLANASIESKEPREVLEKLANSIARVTIVGEGLDLTRLVIAEGRRFPPLGRAFFEQGHEAGAVRLASHFARWHTAGMLDIPNPRFAADLFLGMVNCIRLPLLLGATHQIDPLELNRWLDFVVTVFVGGLRRHSPKKSTRRIRRTALERN